jgi:hypothetical protein
MELSPLGGMRFEGVPAPIVSFPPGNVFLADRRDPTDLKTFLVSSNGSVAVAVNRANERCLRPTISADASRIAFDTEATNLTTPAEPATPLISDVFSFSTTSVLNLAPAPVKASANSMGAAGNLASSTATLSETGTHIAFESDADNLAEETDENLTRDVFVRHLESARTIRMNRDAAGFESEKGSVPADPYVYLGGRAVTYESTATNLLNECQDSPPLDQIPDTNGRRDVFESQLQARFIRGDVDQNGQISLTDAQIVFNFLFQGGPRPVCMDGADANGSNIVDQSDGQYILDYLFNGQPPPPPPFPGCGFDPDFDCTSCKSRHPNCSDGHDH